MTSQYSICIYTFMYSCGDLHAHTPFMLAFKIMIMAINVEPDSRTSSSMVAPSCADLEGGQGVRTPPWQITKI